MRAPPPLLPWEDKRYNRDPATGLERPNALGSQSIHSAAAKAMRFDSVGHSVASAFGEVNVTLNLATDRNAAPLLRIRLAGCAAAGAAGVATPYR